MDIRVSQRAQSIKPSPTLSVTARANELKAAGKDILSLAAGEPDFDTPDFIKKAAIKALKDGFTKYTPVGGTASLKKAIIAKFERENGLSYEPDQILVSVGCKHSIYNLTQALLNPGDEVIIPAPYWVSYPDMVKLAGAEPVIIKTTINDKFKITKDQLRGAITKNTRMFIINSPSNPTGVNYSPEELQSLAEILLEHPLGWHVPEHRQCLPGAEKPHCRPERCVQGLFDDRLAHRLCRRQQEPYLGDG